MTIPELMKEIRKINQNHGFNCLDVPEKLMLIVSEIAEAMEEHRSGNGWLYYPSPNEGGQIPKPEGIGIELADVVIRIFDLCEYYQFDLEKAIELKIQYNASRPFKHGKRY